MAVFYHELKQGNITIDKWCLKPDPDNEKFRRGEEVESQ